MQKVNQKRNYRKGIFTSILIAMFAAVGAVTSWISIPMPSGVPITLQTFGMALIGYTLGYKYGTVSVLIYVALGAVGLPVYAGFLGGLGKLLGLTGGFIFGFIFMAFLCGLVKLKPLKNCGRVTKIILAIVFGLIGLLICHFLGVLQFCLLNDKDVSFTAAALAVSVPYFIKDIVSVVAAYFVSLIADKFIAKAY